MTQIAGLKFKSPLLWLIIALTAFSIWKTFSLHHLQSLVRSDGRGYYAYLPAVFIYGDQTYQQTLKAEAAYHDSSYNQEYLYRTDDGKTYNKYFPGKALGDLPFFLAAWLASLLFGLPADGYSDGFMIFQFVSSLFYCTCGLLLFSRLCRKLFPVQQTDLLITLLMLSGPTLFYCFLSPYYTHHFSFFLFSAAALLFLDFSESGSTRSLVALGLTFGIIFLVRPTNLVFVLFLPLLLKDKHNFRRFFSMLLNRKWKALLLSLCAFLSMPALLLVLWKWQTGHFFVWSYNAEGFDFLHARWWSVLFSFRIGMFVHIPALIAVVVAVVLLMRRNAWFAAWWSAYFIALVWIIAAWWCWDFESPYSVRPLSEHFLFLAFPLFMLELRRPVVNVFLAATAVTGLVRIAQFESGYMVNQRFTSSNYFKSLAFWKKANFDRWNFNLSCHPFGKVTDSRIVVEKTGITTLTSTDEFALSGSLKLEPVNREGLMYYTVTLEKQFSGERMDDVYLVVDAASGKSAKRYYASVSLYADRFEGRNNWTPLRFEGTIPDYFREYEHVTVYIWNKGKRELAIRNYKAVIETYGK